MSGYETLRQRHVERFYALFPEHQERLTWARERIDAERERSLRELVRAAKEGSPWHRERLSDVDPDGLRLSELTSLPTMTKDDLMGHFDDVVTDRRVTLAAANAHLEALKQDDYFLEELHVVASGGSSGKRGVFVWGWDAWTTAMLGLTRTQLRDRLEDPELAALPNVIAVVAADHPWHMTSAMPQTFASPFVQSCRFPVTLPVEDLVAGLNALEPPALTLFGYPSTLAVLVEEARAGRLRIALRRVGSTSEPLSNDLRAAIEETWDAPLANWWGTSEAGPTGVGCFRGHGMHVCEDLVIVEPVDEQGRAVAPGERSAKIYLTNLFNPIQPIIRYEVTDEVVALDEPCACGSAHRRVDDIQGRHDDVFDYAGIRVHPHVFRSALTREAGIIEYQVRQSARGAEVFVLVGADFKGERVAKGIDMELARLGVPSPQVHLLEVDRLERQASGKLKRFVPLGATG